MKNNGRCCGVVIHLKQLKHLQEESSRRRGKGRLKTRKMRERGNYQLF
jgi:hypothetical protein